MPALAKSVGDMFLTQVLKLAKVEEIHTVFTVLICGK